MARSYAATVQWLFSQLPMFQRVGAPAFKPKLDTSYKLSALLGNPHRNLSCIHVAGTNGKGSTSHTLASILQHSGYKVGLYTSPHLRDFRERIRINGQMISEEEVIQFVDQFEAGFLPLKPSFFEWSFALALHSFQLHQVDVAVIEVGMGGRLDSTNIISPRLSVITSIGMDHMQFLGDTLGKIAFEKAGIIKPGIPVVVGEVPAEAREVIEEVAAERGSLALFVEDSPLPPLPSDLTGSYQAYNMRTVHLCVYALRDLDYNLPDAAVQSGAMSVVKTTGLMGRWQELPGPVRTLCDVGHNRDGLREVARMLSTETYNTLHMVIGTVNDKDVRSMLSELPAHARYYFAQAQIPRALPSAELQQIAAAVGLRGTTYSTVAEALAKAQQAAQPGDLIFVGGSAFVVAEVV